MRVSGDKRRKALENLDTRNSFGRDEPPKVTERHKRGENLHEGDNCDRDEPSRVTKRDEPNGS